MGIGRDNESAPLRDKHGIVDEPKTYVESKDALIDAGSADGNESTDNQLTSRKIVLTIVIISSWMVRGMTADIAGPTIQELLKRTGTSYEQMSLAMMCTELVRLITLLPLGLVQERIRRYSYLQFGFAMLCYLLCMCILPRATNLLHLEIAFGIHGVGEACSVNAGNALILDIWKKRATVPLQLGHSSYGLGALLIPEIVSVFIPKSNRYIPSTTDALTDCAPLATGNVSSNNAAQHSYPIDNAFITLTILTAICAVALVACHLLEHRRHETDVDVPSSEAEHCKTEEGSRLSLMKQVLCPSQAHSTGQMCLVTWVLVLASVFIMQAGASQNLYGRFAAVLGLRHFCFPLKESLSLGTVYFSAVTLGGVAFAVFHFLDITITLVAQMAGFVLGSVCLYFVASVPTVMITLALLGFFTGPIFASAFLWMNSLLYVKGSYLTILSASSSLGTLLYTFLAGWLLQEVGPRSVLTLGAAGCPLLIVTVCVMVFISCVARRKHSSGKLLPDEHDEQLSTGGK